MPLTKHLVFLKKYKQTSVHEYEDSNILNELANLKKVYVSEQDEVNSKFICCLESMFRIQYSYKQVWEKLRKKSFYEAWCTLEQCEIGLKRLLKHKTEIFEEFGFSQIFSSVLKLQSLYPYRYFLSPEILEKKVRCNICGNIVSMRNHCGHIVGEIYNGEYCYRIVEDLEFLGISLVQEPVQKYSVAFSSDTKTGNKIDQFDYQLLEYLLDYIKTDFESWDVIKTTKKFSIEYFKEIDGNDKCPCGSDKIFKECCSSKNELEIQHYEFLFDRVPETCNPYTLLDLNGKKYKNV
jgi:hypothetical protein